MWDRDVLIMQHRVGGPDRLPSHKEESLVRGDHQQGGLPVSKTSTNILGAVVLKLQNIYFETLLFIFFILTLTYVGGSCIRLNFK